MDWEVNGLQHKATGYELFPQELPELDTVPSLEAELRKGAKERLANNKLQAQQRRSEKQTSVPTVYKLVHPSPQKYKKCQHSGNFILDREVLKPVEHINFIALPKEVVHHKWPHYIEHKLSSATNRIKTLARPGTSRVRNTLEQYSTTLSPKQKQHLTSLLEPKPFVSIQESIGYARQQRSDDAMWRRHRAKQERKLLHKVHCWEIKLLRQTMHKLSKCLASYYLYTTMEPLGQEAANISRVVLRRISRLLEVKIRPDKTGQEKDVIDDFYVEFADKVGEWVWRMMQQTGITFDKQKSFSYVGQSESFVSVNSSVFELPRVGGEMRDGEELEPLSIISLELVYDCVEEAVLTVERESVCVEVEDGNVGEEALQEGEASRSKESLAKADSSDKIDTRASMNESAQDGDETEDDMEDQVTVIENILADEADEDQSEEKQVDEEVPKPT
uniref:Uncharacterized protein n=1 Tax=Anopheles quadriannulatus TaxID=34691 RepID=A0A182WX13_ANOQN